MATRTDLGKIFMTNGGEYDPEVTYEKMTFVLYRNSTFLALQTVRGIEPSNDLVNWQYMARGFADEDFVAEKYVFVDRDEDSEFVDEPLIDADALGGQKPDFYAPQHEISDKFSEEKTYAVGDYTIHQNSLYRFTSSHSPGPFDGTEVVPVTVAGELQGVRGDFDSTMKIYALESDETFDFNDPNHNPGVYRMGRLNNTINAPFSGAGIAYSNVLVIRKPDYDTLAMLVFPYSRKMIYYRTGARGDWATQPWLELVTNADVSPKNQLTSNGSYFTQVGKIVYVFFRFFLTQPINQAEWVITDSIPSGISLPAQTTQFPVVAHYPDNVAYGEVRSDGTVRVAVYFETSATTQLYANFWYLAT